VIGKDQRRSRESVVSIFTRAKTYFPAALMLSVMTLTTADADMVGVGGCVGGRGSVNCVVRVGPAGDPYIRTVPQPDNDADKERAAARDRKWIDRCHPTIAQDRYGVPRYNYTVAGCEFGVIE
jgi:hypothetical protein